jgi:pectinesterase
LACVIAIASGAIRTVTVTGSIQEAIDTIPADNRERVVVLVPNGVYDERVRIDQNRVTLRGESRDGVVLRKNFPRPEYDRRYDRIGPGVLNLFGDDCVIENLTVENTSGPDVHAFAVYGHPQRTILADCTFSGVGDTVSLWNTTHGMYYHTRCHFRGEVDFLCPRGWCFVRDSTFEETRQTAAIWHDGHMQPDKMKFVLRDCKFDGVEDFWLGRNHYPSQFYLLGCQFSERMADKPIGVVKDLSTVPESEHALYKRKYFHDCHRDGGDYPWHADNLSEAAGSPEPDEVTPAWTFDGKWDPESEAAPRVVEVQTEGDRVYVQMSEPVAGAASLTVKRSDGSVAAYAAGDGTRRLEFVGGSEAAPSRLVPDSDETAYGATATLTTRYVSESELPKATVRRPVTWLAIGDSTVADYAANSPLQGWAWGLRGLVDDRVTVVNAAKNGRSSKSFRSEGLWDGALRRLAAEGKKPDVVFIQFGHNDNLGKGPGRETDPAGEFRDNLRRYISEARAVGATPILVTPPQRRQFDANGRSVADPGNEPYAEAARAVAAEEEIALVDLSKLTLKLFDGLGQASSDSLQVAGDTTHFSPSGARRLAAIVLDDLVVQDSPIKTYVLIDRIEKP